MKNKFETKRVDRIKKPQASRQVLTFEAFFYKWSQTCDTNPHLHERRLQDSLSFLYVDHD